MNRSLLVGCCVLSLTGTAWAINEGPSSRPQAQTETWLQLQVRGDAASKVPQTATPSEREQSLQRWLDNYKHPIPEFFEQEKGGKVKPGR